MPKNSTDIEWAEYTAFGIKTDRGEIIAPLGPILPAVLINNEVASYAAYISHLCIYVLILSIMFFQPMPSGLVVIVILIGGLIARLWYFVFVMIWGEIYPERVSFRICATISSLSTDLWMITVVRVITNIILATFVFFELYRYATGQCPVPTAPGCASITSIDSIIIILTLVGFNLWLSLLRSARKQYLSENADHFF